MLILTMSIISGPGMSVLYFITWFVRFYTFCESVVCVWSLSTSLTMLGSIGTVCVVNLVDFLYSVMSCPSVLAPYVSPSSSSSPASVMQLVGPVPSLSFNIGLLSIDQGV